MSNITIKQVTINQGESLSNSVEVNDQTLVGIITDANAAGTLNFLPELNEDQLPYYNAAGTLVSVSLGATRWIGVYGIDFSGIDKLRLQLSAAATTQTTVKLVFKGFSGA